MNKTKIDWADMTWKTKQVARCGNAVCPPMAEAMIRANYIAAPVYITTMAQLAEIVAA